jgi:hypothetical protein
MIASLDFLVQLNPHFHDQQSWQASQAVSIGVLRSSPISVVFEQICGTISQSGDRAGVPPVPRHFVQCGLKSLLQACECKARRGESQNKATAYIMIGLLSAPRRR